MEVERLADLWQKAFEGKSWHGPSVQETLAGVTADRAAARPIPGAHTIWELVLHMTVWKDVTRRRLEGEKVRDVSPEEDWPPVGDTSEAAWRKSLERLENSQRSLRQSLSGLADARLDDVLPGESGSSWSAYQTLHGVIQHDLYHAGQIAVLKKALR